MWLTLGQVVGGGQEPEKGWDVGGPEVFSLGVPGALEHAPLEYHVPASEGRRSGQNRDSWEGLADVGSRSEP